MAAIAKTFYAIQDVKNFASTTNNGKNLINWFLIKTSQGQSDDCSVVPQPRYYIRLLGPRIFITKEDSEDRWSER